MPVLFDSASKVHIATVQTRGLLRPIIDLLSSVVTAAEGRHRLITLPLGPVKILIRFAPAPVHRLFQGPKSSTVQADCTCQKKHGCCKRSLHQPHYTFDFVPVSLTTSCSLPFAANDTSRYPRGPTVMQYHSAHN